MKLKPIILSFLCVFLIYNKSKAQNITINAGLNFSDIYVKSSIPDTAFNLGMSTGFRLGGEYTLNITQYFGVNTGLYFSQRKVSHSGSDKIAIYENNALVNYLDIPLNLKYSFPIRTVKFSVKTGALLGLAIYGSQYGFSKSVDGSWNESWDDKIVFGAKGAFKRMDLGYNIGISANIGKIEAGINFNNSFLDVFDRSFSKNLESTAKWRVINLFVGYKLR